MNSPVSLSGVVAATPTATTTTGTPQHGAFTAAPGTAIDAEVVQAQAANLASSQAVASGLQTQVILRLGNALVAATLPGPPPQVGTRLPLVYLGTQNGQPQFLLAPPRTQQMAAQVLLSGPGQLLGLLQQMEAPASANIRAGGQGARVEVATTPVWTNPAQPVQQAAQLLASALSSSGLFYESQLGAWAQGRYPLSALLVQPQGRLSPLLQQTASTLPHSAPVAAQTPAALAAQTEQPSIPAAQSQSIAPATVPFTDDAAPAPRHAGVAAYGAVQTVPQAASDPAQLVARLPAELRGIVQQQLQSLMQGQVVWEGLLWPGQTARWSLRPDPDGGAAQGAATAQRSWSTQIDLNLPQLGVVQARLQLRGHQVEVALLCSQAAQQCIDPALPQLQSALRASGLEVTRVQLGLLPGSDTP